ncbi:hypothetical protein [Streptomyces chrestomyceticus]|uniref:hypothetical protein n=1 Tax=Streptomyces chrestomyceticus TaxID=68185 RepID=UPI0037AC54C7
MRIGAELRGDAVQYLLREQLAEGQEGGADLSAEGDPVRAHPAVPFRRSHLWRRVRLKRPGRGLAVVTALLKACLHTDDFDHRAGVAFEAAGHETGHREPDHGFGSERAGA